MGVGVAKERKIMYSCALEAAGGRSQGLCVRANAVGGGCGEGPASAVLQYEEGKVMAVTLTSLSGWLSGQGRSRELSHVPAAVRACV